VAKAFKKESVQVSSAGVAAMPGQPASRETQAVLKARGAEMEHFRSRAIDEEILAKADLIIAMTNSHAEVVKRIYPERADSVFLLGDFIEGCAGQDVPDPIGMGMDAYEEVAEVIELAIPQIKEKITQ